MTVIDELRAAIDSYETDFCATQIVDFSIVRGGTVLNEGERFQFKVQVTNQGNLDMRNVRLRAIGTPYADVATGSSSFGNSATSHTFNLDAHQTHTTGYFRGRAKASTGGVKNIVLARVDSWDANLDHILRDHSDAGSPEGRLSMEIFPT